MQIDTSVDLRADAGGNDLDSSSGTLRRYHRLLWSKPLPSGAQFELKDASPQAYLHHQSGLGEFWLSSDSIIHTYSYWPSMQPIISQLQDGEVAEFEYLGCTIGGMTLFPSNRIDGKPTINGARGMHPQIRDRFDLTLECIRRYYGGQSEPNPLAKPLARYADFFALFGDFNGYVEFFLLQDLLDAGGQVRFLLPFDDFPSPTVPGDVETYRDFRACSLDFVRARNARIQSWADANL